MVYLLNMNKTLKDGTKVTYLYLAHNIRKNKVPVRSWTIPLGRKEEAEVYLRNIALNQKSFTPDSAENLSSALLCAYLDIFEEVELIKIVNDLTYKERDQGITPGHYILFCVLNRATDPKSKNQLKEWFEGTILKEIYPNASKFLTVQHIINHFSYFNQEIMDKIFLNILKKVIELYGGIDNALLFDSTNFYTYISDHPFNNLPRRGHSKEGRKYLNLINLSLLLEKNKGFPLYYKLFPGNMPDGKIFKQILPEISDFFDKLKVNRPEITLIFDKGNNSAEAMKLIEENNWGFIGSLRPSSFKKLLRTPFTEFSKIYDTKKNHPIYAFRTESAVYTDKPKSIILTYDETVHNKNLKLLNSHIAKRFNQLKEFTIKKLNTKPQWREPEKILKHIDTQILKQKDFKKIIEIILEIITHETIEYQQLRWGLNSKSYIEKINSFGKSIIFSNKLDWSTKDIVLGYREQFIIEHKFSEIKSDDYIKIRPVYHWKDKNIRVHVFICVLALLGRSILELKFRKLKIKNSFQKLVGSLKKIHKINLCFNKNSYKTSILPHLNMEQKKMLDKLNLRRYFL